MPTPNGPIGNPRYDVNDAPQFPVHLTAISDFFANLVGGTVPTYGDLTNVPAKFPGMRQWVTADQAIWIYTGAGWKRTPALVSEQNTIYDSGSTSVASGTTMATFALPALPYATIVKLRASAEAGNRGVSGIGFDAVWASNAGSLNQTGGRPKITTTAGNFYWSMSKPGSLSLPPNTAATVTLKTGSTDTLFWGAFAEALRSAV
jgi:hypothetical protein